MENNNIEIKMPQYEIRRLCKELFEAMERYYSNPENMRKYEEWLKEHKLGKKGR